jgi:hypothetical protein
MERASSHFRGILRNFEGPRDFCGVWSARRAARTPQRECMTLVRITLRARTATFAQHSPSLAPTHTRNTLPAVTCQTEFFLRCTASAVALFLTCEPPAAQYVPAAVS